MSVRSVLSAIAASVVMCRPVLAQTRGDSAAVTAAFVRYVLQEVSDSGVSGHVRAVVVDSGSTAWGAYAAGLLRAALPRSRTPRSDTARYYAMNIVLDSIRIDARRAVVWASWYLCGEEKGLNFWMNPSEYSLVRVDSGWVTKGRRVTSFIDGVCDPYPGRRR